MLCYVAWGRHFLGDHSAADLLREAAALLRASGTARSLMCMQDVQWGLGFIAAAEGLPVEALEHCRAALADAHTLRSPLAIGRSSCFLGTELAMRGRLGEAVALLRDAERLLVGCGDDAALWAACALHWVSPACRATPSRRSPGCKTP